MNILKFKCQACGRSLSFYTARRTVMVSAGLSIVDVLDPAVIFVQEIKCSRCKHKTVMVVREKPIEAVPPRANEHIVVYQAKQH